MCGTVGSSAWYHTTAFHTSVHIYNTYPTRIRPVVFFATLLTLLQYISIAYFACIIGEYYSVRHYLFPQAFSAYVLWLGVLISEVEMHATVALWWEEVDKCPHFRCIPTDRFNCINTIHCMFNYIILHIVESSIIANCPVLVVTNLNLRVHTISSAK